VARLSDRAKKVNHQAIGDPLAELFHSRYQPMVRLAAWLVGDSTVAEDVVQDAFVRLNTSGVDLSQLESAHGYLRTTVVNLCRTRLRRLGLARLRLTDVAAGRPDAHPGPESYLVDEDLARAVAALPRRQRECVVLRYTEDLTVQQIADTIGTSAGSVKTHLHRALNSLANTLEEPPKPAASRTDPGATL
jgi:RNA polymerase sigma-70 factor (sigma-E family)